MQQLSISTGLHACTHCLAHSAAAQIPAELTTKLACICKYTRIQCRLHKPGNMCPLPPLGGNLHCRSGELRVQWPIHHGVRLMPCCCLQVLPHPAHRAAGGVQRWRHDRPEQGPGQSLSPARRMESTQHLHLRCAGTCSFRRLGLLVPTFAAVCTNKLGIKWGGKKRYKPKGPYNDPWMPQCFSDACIVKVWHACMLVLAARASRHRTCTRPRISERP